MFAVVNFHRCMLSICFLKFFVCRNVSFAAAAICTSFSFFLYSSSLSEEHLVLVASLFLSDSWLCCKVSFGVSAPTPELCSVSPDQGRRDLLSSYVNMFWI